MANAPGVCTPWAEIGDMPCLAYDDDPGLAEQMLQFASDVLYDLTGRQWPGECTETVRPCADRRVAPGRPTWFPTPAERGSWGTCSCNRANRCGCTTLSEVKLSNHVLSVDEVKVDGEVVPAPEYVLLDEAYLVGLTQADGSMRSWPCCQRLDLEDSEVGTWSVTFTHGGMPPVGGTLAAASLACELLKAFDAEAKGCRLPKRVTSITRQNVTVAVLDPLTLFSDGFTGLAEVDLWVASVIKGRQRRRGRLIVPGRSRRPFTRGA